MRFRLGKSWFSTGLSALAFAFILTPSAFAMTVTLFSSGNGTGGGSSSVSTFFFPASPVAAVSSPFTNYVPVDLSQTDSTLPLQVVFNVTTSATPNPSPSSGSTGSQNMLVVTVTGASGGSVAAVPIITVNNGGCNGTACGLFGNGYYHGAIVPSGTFQISLNMAALCNDYKAEVGSFATGCNSNLIPAPGQNLSGTPAVTTGSMSMILTFGIVSTNPANPSPVLAPALTDTQQVNLNFSTNGIASGSTNFQCNLGSAYSPKDSAIWVDGTQFGSGQTTANTLTPAPPDGLASVIVFGKEFPGGSGFTPLSNGLIATYQANQSINQAIALAPNQVVLNFQNSSSASSPNDYAIGFIGVDQYGFLFDNSNTANPATAYPPGACVFEFPVQVAAIQGFLQNSKCFIASAAFRGDTAPLKLLRQFRGEFLEQFGLGRSFVHWYYAWSPNAAEWLISNPEFRFPILLALIPLQILAWLILHPAVLTVLMMTGFALMGYSVSGNRRKQELRG